VGAKLSPGIGLDLSTNCVDHVTMGYIKRFVKKYLPMFMLAVVSVWAGVFAYLVVGAVMQEPEFDPWGDFSVQRVIHDGEEDTDEVPGVEHVFSISETKQIETSGVKCLDNDQKEVITIGGVVYWYMVIPPGFQSEAVVYEGNSTMNPGCTSYTYMNTIPKELIEEVNLKLETEPYVIMNIQGYTVPYVNGKEHGARATWSTENFAFVR